MIVTKKRSLIKSVSWRVLGSLDTFFLSLIIINYSSENYTYNLAFYIASLEYISFGQIETKSKENSLSY